MAIPDSLRVMACGVTESGKDYLLRRLFLDKAPRALILDPLGEHVMTRRLGSRNYEATTLEDLRAVLKRAAREGQQWRIICHIDPTTQGAALARMLLPAVLRERGAYPETVGGMALYCGELSMFAPTSAAPEIAALWTRGRHVGLSIFGATQRPHGVAVVVRSMSRFLVVCRTHEPRDLSYLGAALGSVALEQVEALPWRWSLLYDLRSGDWFVLDDAQRIIRRGSVRAPAAQSLEL